jgi:hypothetical protein
MRRTSFRILREFTTEIGRVGQSGVWIQLDTGKKRFFSYTRRPDRLWGPHDLILNVFRNSFTGIKRPEFEIPHSPLSSAEVKNEWSYTSPSLPSPMSSWRGQQKNYLFSCTRRQISNTLWIRKYVHTLWVSKTVRSCKNGNKLSWY